MLRSTTTLLALLALSGCKDNDDEPGWEGRHPGECDDGADNDGDGMFDCADSDCTNAPECLPDTGSGLDQDELEAAWNALLERVEYEVEQEGVPGVSVAVLVDGELAFAGGVGVHTYYGGSPVGSDTVYRWNSVSKMHTATAVLRAVEAGTASVDDPITDWVPEFSLNGGDYDPDDITLHHLLSHSSGIPDVWTTSCSDTSDGGLEDYYTENLFELMGPPGAFYNYSNNNWNLLGLAAEGMYGLPFLELIDAEVLDPTGMSTGTFDANDAVEGPYAIGIDSDYDYYTPHLHDCAYMRPCTMLHGSVLDLAETARLHLADGDELLSEDTVQAMRSQLPTGYPDGSTVGWGQFTYSYRGVPYISHTGSGAGFRSQWSIVPEQGFGVVVVANASWADPYQLVQKAFDLFLEHDPDWTPESTQTDPESWTDYEGYYEDPNYWGSVKVEIGSDDKLSLTMLDLGGDSYRLYQYGGDTFFFVRFDYWYSLRFMRDENDEVAWMVNRYWVGTRQEVDSVAPGPAPSTEEARAWAWEHSGRLEAPDGARPMYDD